MISNIAVRTTVLGELLLAQRLKVAVQADARRIAGDEVQVRAVSRSTSRRYSSIRFGT